jgi:hypothetical protein
MLISRVETVAADLANSLHPQAVVGLGGLSRQHGGGDDKNGESSAMFVTHLLPS